MINTVIKGSGHYLPTRIIKNEYFLEHEFYDEGGNKIDKPNSEIIEKFKQITEIEERRYITDDLYNSDIATIAGEKALEDAGIDKEELDYVIVASNYGDIDSQNGQTDVMPSMSARVKNKLGIKNNSCRPYDMIFGCPGWIEGFILAHQLIQGGSAKKILVIGSETLSRAVDSYDRSAMIFADGAGAVVLEAQESEEKIGVIAYDTISDNGDELSFLVNAPSLNQNHKGSTTNISMRGRKVYEYALRKVPALIKRVLDGAEIDITKVNKILLHQANAKMDHAMVERLFKLYKQSPVKGIAPMTVQKFGNSSVATIPTMYDLVAKEQLGNHKFNAKDYIVMGSVGAGMNVNAVLYKFP